MPLMPFQILGMWLRVVLSLALLVAAGYLLGKWYENRYHDVPERVAVAGPGREGGDEETVGVRRVAWHFGFNRETAYLLSGLALVTLSFGGGGLGYRGWKALRVRTPAPQPPLDLPPHEVREVRRPDGTVLHVGLYGPADAPPVVLTHGWGLNGAEWCYVKHALAGRCRLIVWDLPGLGKSVGPTNKDWSLEKMAGDLDAVLALAGDKPAVIVGHSIGGMIALTFCQLYPQALVTRVSGLVLVHTTYTNPVRTTSMAPLYTALQKPVLEPLCWLMIGLAPLVWLMNWLSYLNGSLHRSTDSGSFSGHEGPAQLEYVTRFTLQAWPAVLARGMLGMFRYDAEAVLPSIHVPTLVVAADDDRHCKYEASQRMTMAIPGARMVTLRPARHCGHFEHYEPFTGELTKFVDACQSGARRDRAVLAPTS